jgi:hypothetical protein
VTKRFLAFGAGKQSTALLVLSALGKIHKFDSAIFADTQDEPAWVYENLSFYEKWARERGIEVTTVTKGKLSQDLRKGKEEGSRIVTLPAWTLGEDGREGLLRRQCTREYKGAVVEKEIRRQLGYAPRKRVKEKVVVSLGITTDEAGRMKPSPTKWIENNWPLIDLRMSRQDCVAFLEREGLPVPRKSSCVYCPFHSDSFWKDLKRNHPAEFDKAVKTDELIRDMTKTGIRQPIYLHRSLRPLAEVPFDQQREMFGNECEGYCGV